ncbi:MAG: hypothetical protein AAB427_12300 [Chloroflexota bacterium]
MAIRRVYVIWSHPLFHESVRALLQHPRIQWVGATADLAVARGQIASVRPDTVLVEGLQDGLSLEVLAIMNSCEWKVLLLGLNLSDNTTRVCYSEQRIVGRADDLLRLVLTRKHLRRML